MGRVNPVVNRVCVGKETDTNKYAPKRKSKLIPKEDIFEELRKIDITNDYYITSSGKVYREYTEGMFYLRKDTINKNNGYRYIVIVEKDGKKHTRRLHRLVAQAFIPNPNNYPIVGHKNNVKSDSGAENLYWTTNTENIQKAVDDKLLVNKKWYEDSQSNPVIVYNEYFEEIMRFGSACECHKALKVSKSTVARHCKGQIKTKTRTGYYFRYDNTHVNL